MNRAYGVIIPVKDFGKAKARLTSVIDDQQRSGLAKTTARIVVAAAAPADTFIVCDNNEVAAWARAVGAGVLTQPRPGLNEAVAFGVAELQRRGYPRAVIAHGDLPLARELAWVADFEGVSIVTDHGGDGTNVLSLPTAAPFRFGYGPGSGPRHRHEALRCGLSVRWIKDHDLSCDIDTADDLNQLDPMVRQRLLGDTPGDVNR